MSSENASKYDLKYRPPWWHGALALLAGGGMLFGAVYLVGADPNGAIWYIGILGVIGAMFFFAGTCMLLYPVFTPCRFRVYEDRLEYHHQFSLRLVKVPFNELKEKEVVMHGDSPFAVQLHRKQGLMRVVYPKWFESKEVWRKVSLFITQRVLEASASQP